MSKMAKRKILVHVAADGQVGMGHVYNMLTLLPHFPSDEILVAMRQDISLGVCKFDDAGYPTKTFRDTGGLLDIICEFEPSMVFNDVLDTDETIIGKIQDAGCFVVNFEDAGTGSKLANLVFNPIYHGTSTTTMFFGEQYACIREEFRSGNGDGERRRAVLTFGGVDPAKLTLRLLRIMRHRAPDYEICIIVGSGFLHRKQIYDTVAEMKNDGIAVTVYERTDKISEFIRGAMFAITANGRTVFEIASLNVPLITISANAREEERHFFPKSNRIGYHMGLHSSVSDGSISEAIRKMESTKHRSEFKRRLSQLNLGDSTHNVVRIINSEFGRWSARSEASRARRRVV